MFLCKERRHLSVINPKASLAAALTILGQLVQFLDAREFSYLEGPVKIELERQAKSDWRLA